MSESVGRRVLIVVQNLPVPFDRRVWMEATTLARAGYDVSVICPKLKGYTTSRERLEDVSIYRYAMPFDPRTRIGFVGEYVYGLLRTLLLSLVVSVRGGFDILHACNPPETFWLLGAFWKPFGKRYVFDHHDLSPELFAAKFPGDAGLTLRLLTFMERMNFRMAHTVIAPNASHREVAVGRGRVDPERVYVVRSGPSPERFTTYEPDSSLKMGKRHLVAYLGEIGEQDGVDLLVRALAHLRDLGDADDIHAVFIGGGTARSDVMTLAAELGLESLTTFTGVVSDDDLCRILSSADLAVDPVPKNPWSDRSTMNKIIEYLYFGLPVVGFDLKEARVSAGEAGCFVEGDHRDLARTIREVLDDPNRRAAMSEVGMTRFNDELSWERSAPVLLEGYAALVSTIR